MTDQHPIIPPRELVSQWEENWHHSKSNIELELYMAAQSAQWGADQELEACCAWLPKLPPWSADDLRRHRRPKPPSLAEQGLAALRSTPCTEQCHYDALFAALNRLAELEDSND